MPRYQFSDGDMRSLTAYLKTLSTGSVPGVTEDTLHFATIVTPDADPIAREGMLATMRQFFQDRNHIIAGGARPLMHTDRGVMFRVTRHWELHVWELSGPPSGWAEQLQRNFAREPVFAVISGLGGGDWSPIHDFCEARQVPCLLPNVDLPGAGEAGFFSVYFSRGVLLEAALLADGIFGSENSTRPPGPHRLVQVLRPGAAAEAGARQLEAAGKARGWTTELRLLKAVDTGNALTQATAVEPGTALVLWLSPADIAALPAQPPRAVDVWLSGLLGGLELMPLPEAWRARAGLSYPLELPERRSVSMKLPEGWFKIKRVALVDPRVQVQTYVALQILSETVGEMQVSFVPEYLIERLEVMLSHRLFNGIYPRLSLGAGQRFASKGGYLAHFDASRKLIPEGEWRVP
jgi:hypothetical protein